MPRVSTKPQTRSKIGSSAQQKSSRRPPQHPSKFETPTPNIVGEIVYNRDFYSVGDNPSWLNISSFPEWLHTCCRKTGRKVNDAIGADPGVPLVATVALTLGHRIISNEGTIVRLIAARQGIYDIDKVPAMLVDEAAAISSKWKVAIPNPSMSGYKRINWRINSELADEVHKTLGLLDMPVNSYVMLCMIFAFDSQDDHVILKDHRKIIRDTVKMFLLKCRMSLAWSLMLVEFINDGAKEARASKKLARAMKRAKQRGGSKSKRYRYVRDSRRTNRN